MGLTLHQGLFEVQAGAVRVQFPEPRGDSTPEYAVACAQALLLGELLTQIEAFAKLAASAQGDAQGQVDKAIGRMTDFMKQHGLQTPAGFPGANGAGS